MQTGNKYGILLTLKAFMEHSITEKLLVLVYTYLTTTAPYELLSNFS